MQSTKIVREQLPEVIASIRNIARSLLFPYENSAYITAVFFIYRSLTAGHQTPCELESVVLVLYLF